MSSCDICAGHSNGPCCNPTPDGPPALTPSRLAQVLAEVRAGRCTLRADQCGWDYDCVRHHPETAERSERVAS